MGTWICALQCLGAWQAGKCQLTPGPGAETWERTRLPSPSLPLQQQTHTSCFCKSSCGLQPSRRDWHSPKLCFCAEEFRTHWVQEEKVTLLKQDRAVVCLTQGFCIIGYFVTNIWMVLKTQTETISCFFQLSTWRRPQTKGFYRDSESSWLWWGCNCISMLSSALELLFLKWVSEKDLGAKVSKKYQ